MAGKVVPHRGFPAFIYPVAEGGDKKNHMNLSESVWFLWIFF